LINIDCYDFYRLILIVGLLQDASQVENKLQNMLISPTYETIAFQIDQYSAKAAAHLLERVALVSHDKWRVHRNFVTPSTQ